jgi:hypothetical protein
MKKTRLLSEVHETARGVARIGAIDEHTLRDLDALCLPPVQNSLPNRLGPFAAEPR